MTNHSLCVNIYKKGGGEFLVFYIDTLFRTFASLNIFVKKTTRIKSTSINQIPNPLKIKKSQGFFVLPLMAAAMAAAAAADEDDGEVELLLLLLLLLLITVVDEVEHEFADAAAAAAAATATAAATSLCTYFMCSMSASLPKKSLWQSEQQVVFGPPIRAAC